MLTPTDWQRKPISEIVSTPVTDGPHVTPKFLPDGVPFLSVNNLVDGRIDWTDLRFVSRSDHELFSRKTRPLRGDILIGKAASVGRVAYLDTDREVNIWSPIALIRVKSTYDRKFVYYQLQSFETIRQIELLTNTSSQGNIGMGDIEQIVLSFPSLLEQRAISRALTLSDDQIEMLERLIAKKRAMRQGLMQELLTAQTRLAGHGRDWLAGPLKDFLPLQRGFDLPTSRLVEGPYPVVYSNGVLRHHVKAMVKGPGVVTGRSGTIGAVHYVEDDYWPHNTSLWVTSFVRVDPCFAYYFLAYLGLGRFASGSGVPTLNRNDAHSYVVRLPGDRAEQQAIAVVLSDADAEIDALERQVCHVRNVQQGMMQELLTGRTRLGVEGNAA